MCVCLYSFIVKGFSVCNDVWDILEAYGSTICVVSIISGASDKFRHLRFQTCYISPPKAKLQQPTNWRENDMIYFAGEKIIYNEIELPGYAALLLCCQVYTKNNFFIANQL